MGIGLSCTIVLLCLDLYYLLYWYWSKLHNSDETRRWNSVSRASRRLTRLEYSQAKRQCLEVAGDDVEPATPFKRKITAFYELFLPESLYIAYDHSDGEGVRKSKCMHVPEWHRSPSLECVLGRSNLL